MNAESILPARKAKIGFLARFRKASPLGMIFAAGISVYYLAIFIIPFAIAIWLSFQNWDYIVTPKFVGLKNFIRLAKDPYFWAALKVTAVFSVLEITFAIGLALLLALMFSRLYAFWERFFLAVYYMPVIMPTVVTVYLWQWLYRPTGGAINLLIQTLGLPQQPFLASSNQALYCVIVTVIWVNLGGVTVIMLAGMKDVPKALYDACKLDGAGFWQTFWYITMPLIQPVMVYEVVVSVIGTVQMFEPFLLMPGPGNSTRSLSLYTYELGFRTLNLGFGAAVSLVIFLMLLFATIFQLSRWQVKWEY